MELSQQSILSKYKYAVTYHGIDGLEESFDNMGTFQGANCELSFQFISDYVKTGKWADESQEYERVYTVVEGFHSEPLFDAIRFYKRYIERIISRNIGTRCAKNEMFAERIMDEAAKVVKGKDNAAKME